MKRALKTVEVTTQLTIYFDDATKLYSVEYGELQPKRLEIDGAVFEFSTEMGKALQR
jgi:hypothetical protein